MISTWWVLWMVFMFVFLVTPISYGWGYRGWGAPYPRYIQRRRTKRATANGEVMTSNQLAWGLLGDLVWMVVIIAFVWAALAVWWR